MIHVDDALWFLMEKDPGLTPYSGEIRMHMDRYNDRRWHLAGNNSLTDFANGYHYFGFHRTETGWVFREWLPGADAAWLTGDFNFWAKWEYPLHHIGGGVWEIALDGWDALKHGQHIKLLVGRQGSSFERIPAYITRCVMDMASETLCGQIWMSILPLIPNSATGLNCICPAGAALHWKRLNKGRLPARFLEAYGSVWYNMESKDPTGRCSGGFLHDENRKVNDTFYFGAFSCLSDPFRGRFRRQRRNRQTG